MMLIHLSVSYLEAIKKWLDAVVRVSMSVELAVTAHKIGEVRNI